MKKLNSYLRFGSALGVLFLALWCATPVHAADSDAMRSKCFDTLKTNLAETHMFPEEVSTTLADLDYTEVKAGLSTYYKLLSSFGIDIDQPLFQWRLYSFGNQTGYVHPPFSPFPASTEADKWVDPLKEYVILEEYVTDESGNRNFVSCGFMQIQAEDLMKVTAENYLYDGALLSVTKKAEGYTAWYNSNTSYDYKYLPFVEWKRLFVYPAETANNYFERYSLVDALPANSVKSFVEMVAGYGKTEADYAEMLKKEQETQEMFDKYAKGEMTEEEFRSQNLAGDSMRTYEVDANGNYLNASEESTSPLDPLKLSAKNNIFAMNSYYEAIEAKFPEFAKHLALQGLVPYETLKEIITDPKNTEYKMLWDTILDPRVTTQYAKAKQNGEITENNANSYLEDSLEKIAILAQKPANIEPKNLLTNKLTDEEKISFEKLVAEENTPAAEGTSTDWSIVSVFALLIILTPIVVFTISSSKKHK